MYMHTQQPTHQSLTHKTGHTYTHTHTRLVGAAARARRMLPAHLTRQRARARAVIWNSFIRPYNMRKCVFAERV